jgi:hypothetical protein
VNDCVWCALVKLDPRVANACGVLDCDACRKRLGWPERKDLEPAPLLDVSWIDRTRETVRA